MIEIIVLDDLEQARPLLDRHPHKPYRWLARDMELTAYWFDSLAGSRSVFAAVQGGEIVGLAVVDDLPWDSRLFQKRMGTIKNLIGSAMVLDDLLARAEQWARAAGLEFLICKTYTDDMPLIHALERQGFRLVDTLLDFVYDSRRPPLSQVEKPLTPPGVTIRLAEPSDQAALIEMAGRSFAGHFGRYHSDPRIPREQATQVYEEWLRSSCAGYADWIVVAEIEGQRAGFSTWKKPSTAEQALALKVGHYSIVGVDPAFAGRGLLGLLTYRGMELLDGLADVIEGPTHINNYPMQRGYTRLGWRIADARHAFHKWLD